MYLRKKNKKGSILDVGYVMVFIFAAILIFVIADYTINKFSDKWANNTIVNESPNSIAAVNQVRDIIDTRFDYVSFVLLIGLTLAIIITGWLVAGHPIFSFIYFIVLVIFVIASSIISFVWYRISTESVLSTVVSNFPIADFILTNFPMYIAIVGFVGMLVMFAKPQT